jgi:hypothetical protein
VTTSLPSLRGMGLGDLVKTGTQAVGVQPCAPCQKRAEQLNRVGEAMPVLVTAAAFLVGFLVTSNRGGR